MSSGNSLLENKPGIVTTPIRSLWRQWFTVVKRLMIHTLLSEPVRGTFTHRPQKQCEVGALSLTHIFTVVQPLQMEQIEFGSHDKTSLKICPFLVSAAWLVTGLDFRCEGLNRFQLWRVKSLFSISGSSVETDAHTGRVPIVSKHICVHCLISFSSPTCSH